MNPLPPKPSAKHSVLRTLKAWENRSGKVTTASQMFEECVKEVYDLHDLSEKQLLALHQKFSKHRKRNSVVLVHLELK